MTHTKRGTKVLVASSIYSGPIEGTVVGYTEDGIIIETARAVIQVVPFEGLVGIVDLDRVAMGA